MPIYEYRCSACGFETEFLQRLNDAPHTKCPECGKRKLEKQVSAAGFQLKGTGWYATDFKNSGSKPAAKKKDGETAKGTAGKDAAASGSSSKETTGKESSKADSSGSGTSSSTSTPSTSSAGS